MKSLVSEFPDISKAREKAQLNGGSLQGADYINCVLQINYLTEELENKGCILKGIEHGLVGFSFLEGWERGLSLLEKSGKNGLNTGMTLCRGLVGDKEYDLIFFFDYSFLRIIALTALTIFGLPDIAFSTLISPLLPVKLANSPPASLTMIFAWGIIPNVGPWIDHDINCTSNCHQVAECVRVGSDNSCFAMKFIIQIGTFFFLKANTHQQYPQKLLLKYCD